MEKKETTIPCIATCCDFLRVNIDIEVRKDRNRTQIAFFVDYSGQKRDIRDFCCVII